MIVPSRSLPAVRRVRTSRHALYLAWILVALAFAVVAALCVPWQQSSQAAGKVIAWNPNDRQQVVEAPIEGRVLRVVVTEGQAVVTGEVLVEIADNDPELVDRLERERSANADRVQSARAGALEMENRILDLQESRIRGASAAEARVQVAVDRRTAAEHRVVEAESQRERDALQLVRRKQGVTQGIASERDLEVAEADDRRSGAALAQAVAAASGAESEERAAREDVARIVADADAAVRAARAARDAAEMNEQGAIGELARIEVRLARQSTQTVRAPRDGRVHRILANPGSALVKPGDPLLQLVPDSEERAVELWVPGRDLPFLRDDAEVRLQFEGWPALQMVGPPGTAAGTFGGRVDFVDPAADDAGRFRVMVVPDPTAAAWPEGDLLRQGTRVAGWVLLGRVPLGFEIWRLSNGFPPSAAPSKSEPTIGITRGKGK